MNFKDSVCSPKGEVYYPAMSPTKVPPSAPTPDAKIVSTQPIKHYEDIQEAHVPMATMAHVPLPPSPMIKRNWFCLTIKLIPYHLLNFALGTAAFCVVVTGVSLAGGLIPLCCLGVVVYFVLLHCVRLMAMMDIALANSITSNQAAVVWNIPDEMIDGVVPAGQLRIAPRLTKVSLRSTALILYFASVKFGLAIISAVVVSLPFLPIASEIVSHTAKTPDTYVAGFPVDKFNLSTHPVWYVLATIGYIIVGVFLMHVFGRVSRETTRFVCCTEVLPTATRCDV